MKRITILFLLSLALLLTGCKNSVKDFDVTDFLPIELEECEDCIDDYGDIQVAKSNMLEHINIYYSQFTFDEEIEYCERNTVVTRSCSDFMDIRDLYAPRELDISQFTYIYYDRHFEECIKFEDCGYSDYTEFSYDGADYTFKMNSDVLYYSIVSKDKREVKYYDITNGDLKMEQAKYYESEDEDGDSYSVMSYKIIENNTSNSYEIESASYSNFITHRFQDFENPLNSFTIRSDNNEPSVQYINEDQTRRIKISFNREFYHISIDFIEDYKITQHLYYNEVNGYSIDLYLLLFDDWETSEFLSYELKNSNGTILTNYDDYNFSYTGPIHLNAHNMYDEVTSLASFNGIKYDIETEVDYYISNALDELVKYNIPEYYNSESYYIKFVEDKLGF